ncbi:MAG: hypothetical protein C0499_01245 [Zymomonas sp.]|nr:hypothetical protein [Zymomonas sp.]
MPIAGLARAALAAGKAALPAPDLRVAAGMMPRLNGQMVAGAVIPLGTAALLALIAPQFVWDIKLGDRPILTLWAGMTIASAIFTLWVWLVSRANHDAQPTRWTVAIILGVGLIARALILPTTPILEDDFYRYQWDGAVTAAGQNPYRYPPARFVTAPAIEGLLAATGVKPTPPPPGYQALAKAGRSTLLRVNNPHVATIYPPLAQLGFAAGHTLTPWRLTGWRIVVLGAELLTVALLIGALRAGGLPMIWSAVYWWHPLALKELTNSAHMDALLLPFLAGTLWAVLAQRTRLIALAVAGAAAVKLWPLVILPALLRRTRGAVVLGVAAAMGAMVLIAPQLAALSADAGLSRYAADWERNALAFPALVALISPFASDPAAIVRLVVAAVIIGWVVQCWRRDATAPADRIRAAATAVLLLILLSPTGYPWYVLWLAPFAVLQPRLPVLVVMAAATGYYFDFWAQIQDEPDRWRWIAPLLSAGPAWLALAVERYRKTRP